MKPVLAGACVFFLATGVKLLNNKSCFFLWFYTSPQNAYPGHTMRHSMEYDIYLALLKLPFDIPV